jgi:hypothetical protein
LGAKSPKEIKGSEAAERVGKPCSRFPLQSFWIPQLLALPGNPKRISTAIGAKIEKVVSFSNLPEKNLSPQKSLNQRLAKNFQKMI